MLTNVQKKEPDQLRAECRVKDEREKVLNARQEAAHRLMGGQRARWDALEENRGPSEPAMELLRIDERSQLPGEFTAWARCGTYGTMNVIAGICGRLKMDL